MSDENVPKLRLKPKLAADPIVIPPPPSSVAPAPASLPPPPPGNSDAKAFRLKPKLTPGPQTEDARFPPPPPVGKSAELPAEIGAFPPPPSDDGLKEPSPESEKPASKFTLRPKATAGDPPAIAPDFPPLPTEIPAPSPQDLIPPPVFIDPEQQIGEVPMVVPRTLTSRPFPPPPGNFPPPPGGGKRPLPPWSQSKTSARGGKKNFAKIGGAVVFVVIVLGGAFFAYKKFTAQSPAAKVAITPKVQEPATEAPVEAKSAVPAEEASAVTAPVPEKVTPPPPVPKPVEVVEAPPASAAFKAWVDNLRVGGVRAGTETRVFIGGTAYAPGEMVNPQLGIVFDSYDAETRHLIFKDKTGAIVRRRN